MTSSRIEHIGDATRFHFHVGRVDDACELIKKFHYSGRSLNSKYGTRSLGNVTERLEGQSVAPHYDEGKFLYWKPLDRFGAAKAKRLELQSLPYPKPNAARQLDERLPRRVSDVQPIGAAPVQGVLLP